MTFSTVNLGTINAPIISGTMSRSGCRMYGLITDLAILEVIYTFTPVPGYTFEYQSSLSRGGPHGSRLINLLDQQIFLLRSVLMNILELKLDQRMLRYPCTARQRITLELFLVFDTLQSGLQVSNNCFEHG